MTRNTDSSLVPRDDDPSTNARRTVKSYSDILGRAFKSETYEWNGSTVYSTVLNTFNGRDQVTLSRQFAGPTSSTTYQDTTASYDGFGRLSSRHVPQQDAGVATAYNYNVDGGITSVTGGSRARTFIRAGGTVVAWDNGLLYYSHKDPTMHSVRTTDASGNVWGYGGSSDDRDRQELSPEGRRLDFVDQYTGGGTDAKFGHVFDAA